tara:strand:- start:5227 stop:6231 length:1005 start_codon:yes stop_codon:yes gene_type:complete
MNTILITGGLGYIGSHTVAEMVDINSEVIIVDNLANSYFRIFKTLKELTNKKILFFNTDIRDKDELEKIFTKYKPNKVIHFASLKSVSDSSINPDLYHENNVVGSKVLFDLIIKHNIKNLVFSSSATVYGDPKYLPINESHPLSATNPYAQNKIDIELMLKRISEKYNDLSIKVLRYFNPIGSHSSLKIGESPKGIPNNLMPYIMGVAFGKYKFLKIFGSDFNTEDGTGVRDYIHINDLVLAHQAALKYEKEGIFYFNIGTGKGYSVLNLINTFEEVNEIKIPFKFVDRRKGDVATVFADSSYAERALKWKAKKSLEDMCRDSFLFAKGQSEQK